MTQYRRSPVQQITPYIHYLQSRGEHGVEQSRFGAFQLAAPEAALLDRVDTQVVSEVPAQVLHHRSYGPDALAQLLFGAVQPLAPPAALVAIVDVYVDSLFPGSLTLFDEHVFGLLAHDGRACEQIRPFRRPGL